jgi:hypothetical protein
MAIKIKKRGKWYIKTLYDMEYGEKQWKNLKNEKYTSRTEVMAKKLKNVEKETQTLYDL